MRDAPNNARLRILPLGLAVTLAGCDVDLSGLNQLLDPDPTYLVLPGRKLADGEYQEAAIGGRDAEGAFVIGRKMVDDVPTLAVTPLHGGSTCYAGLSNDYRVFQFGYRNELPFTIPFLRIEDDVTHLHFVNSRCEELLDPIPSNRMPFWPSPMPLESVPGYLTITRDGELNLLEPWSSRTSNVARGVRGYSVPGFDGKLWFHESPQDDPEEGALGLTVRNERLRVTGRIDNVENWVVTQDSVERVAFTRRDELFVAETPELKPQGPIDSGVCRPRFPNGFRGRGISYFSPCDSRTANIYGSARLSDPGPGKSDRKYVLKSNAAGDPVIQFLGDRAVVFLTVSDRADPPALTLWAGYLGDELELIADAPLVNNENDNLPRVNSVGGEFQLYVDAVARVSRMVRWKPGEKVREIATGVSECATPGICLANYDGRSGSGDAIFVAADGTTRRMASKVAPGSIAIREEYGLSMVADFDGEAGNLVYSPGTSDFEVIAERVRPPDFDYLQLLKAVVYLRDWDDDGMGTLGVRVLETGDTFDTDVRATRWREIGWPQPGLLYWAHTGDRQGVWLASLM